MRDEGRQALVFLSLIPPPSSLSSDESLPGEQDTTMKCELPLHDARDLHRLLQAAATLREHGRALEKAASHRRRLDYLAGLTLLDARILCNSLLRASDFLQKFLLQLPCPTLVEVEPPA